jgi:transcriptional regulator with XRE-family HTH domain
MPKLTLQTLGRMLVEKRGTRGVRETAKEIGISPATLSRVERGYLPDLDTFGKVCDWLKIDPGQVLGVKAVAAPTPKAAVHFRKDQAVKPRTARALAEMILAAQRALMVTEGAEGEP